MNMVSHIVDRRLTVWATREVPLYEVLNYLCCPKGVFKTDFKVWAQHPSQAQEDFFEKSFREAMVFRSLPLSHHGREMGCFPFTACLVRGSLKEPFKAWPLLLEARMDWLDLRKVKRLTMTWIMPIKWSKKRWLNSEQTVTSTNSRTEISVQFRCSVVSDSLQAHGR